MVSVVFAMWPSLTPERLAARSWRAGTSVRRRPLAYASGLQRSKPRASFEGSSGFDIAWHCRARADAYDVIDVPSLSEPYGPHGAVADRGCIGAEISQSRAAGRLRQGIRAARRRPRTDLADVA